MKTALRLAAYLTHWNRTAFVAAGLTAGLGTALLTAVVSALPVSAFLPLDAFLITAAPAALVLFDLLFFLGLYRLRRQGRADYTLRMIPGGAHTYPLAVGLAALIGLLVVAAATVLGVLTARLLHEWTAPAAVDALLSLDESALARYGIQGKLNISGTLPTAPVENELFFVLASHPTLRLLLPPTLTEGLMTLSVALCHVSMLMRANRLPKLSESVLCVLLQCAAIFFFCRCFFSGYGLLFPLGLLLLSALNFRYALRDDRAPHDGEV